MPLSVELLIMGEVGPEVLRAISEGLIEAYEGLLRPTEAKERLAVPEEAYNSLRRQYNSSLILAFLRRTYKTKADKVLAITHVDLYVPRLNFVFGQAECPGKFAIISTHRLRPEFYGEPSDRALFLERCVKEAVHEVGHTLGLRHCPDRRCVMAFSNSIWDTDRKGRRPCKMCFLKLLRSVGFTRPR